MRNSKQPNKKCGNCINGYIHNTCSRVDTDEPHITTCEIDNCNNLLTTNSSLIYCVEHLEKGEVWEEYKRKDKELENEFNKKVKKFKNEYAEKLEKVREITKQKYYNMNM